MRIHYKTIFQYILIFLLISWNASGLAVGVIGKVTFDYIVMFVSLGVILLNKRCQKNILVFFAIAIMLDILIVRYTAGGIGLDYFNHAMSGILITYCTYYYNEDFFIHRYVRCITFFSVLSLLCWIISLVVPEIITQITFLSYIPYYNRFYISATQYNSLPVTYHGALFYVFRTGNELTRNNGIFTEPGLYQMVLNTALYFVLFYPEKIFVSDRKKRRILGVLILTIVTAQSTTGYLSLMVLIITYLISNNVEKSNKVPLRKIIVVAVLFLIVDQAVNGMNSLLGNVISSKITFDGGRIAFVSTGAARVDTFAIVLSSLLKHPLGAGSDLFNNMILSANKTSSDGAALMAAAAQLGIQIWVILAAFFAYPAYKNRKSIYSYIAVVFMFINTTLGQSDIFYPALFILSMNFGSYENNMMKGYAYEDTVDV